ncbi:MAG TPA: hypothetical protein VFR94_06250 [Nitrososphaeraceae archaeon]|nr:hypothetical protein [Nitrososphaeraceae archaeon]
MSETMKEATNKILAIIAVIFVTAALISLPYQNQAANAAPPSKKYQVYVTLTHVPANAEDLEVNATIIRMPFFVIVSNFPVETVTSPSNGDRVKFVLTVPAGSSETDVLVCGNTFDLSLSTCEVYPLPSKGGGPIRLEFPYPSATTALSTAPASEEEQALATDEEVQEEQQLAEEVATDEEEATEEATDEAATDEEEAATEEEEEEQALATDEGDTTTDSAEQPIQQIDEGAAEDTGEDTPDTD